MSPAIKVAGGQRVWSRDDTEDALREYLARYGELTAACFSPSSAKWNDRPELVDRYYAGREDGTAWPSLNSIKAHFGGSFNAAREAVGLGKNTSGPAKGRRPAGRHRPVRDVRERVRTVRVAEVEVVSVPAPATKAKPDVRVERVVERVLVPSKADEKLRKQATRAEQRLAKATERLRTARERLREANTTKTTATRQARALARRSAALVARAQETEARASAAMARARAAERELDVEKASKKELYSKLAAAEQKIASLEQFSDEQARLLDSVDLDEARRAAEEVAGARSKVAKSASEKRESEQRAVRAEAQRRAAELDAERARSEAAAEAGRRRQLQEAIVGHARPLTPKEIEALREQGPQGPAVFAAAIKAVAKARAKGSRQELREALRQVAAAAVSWSGRL